MWVVAGLGNPGSKYSRTRHNIGFMVIEEIAHRYEIDLKEKEGKYRIGRCSTDGENMLLIEPLLYMNMSGIVVKNILNKFNIRPENLIVIHDDLDMETGKLRIRRKGSSGGHKGVESIIQSICSKDFIRLKIGIGKDASITAEDYVLRRFGKDEVFLIKEAIKRASDAVTSILLDGLDKAMNRFNTQ
ncbi:MAG: aminoacyl-tRNA hydrolase [Nitrospirota bacterium]